VFTKLRVGYYFLKVRVLAYVGSTLAGQKESQLFKGDRVCALGHNFANQQIVIHFLSNAHGFWVSLELAEDVKCGAERLLHLFCVRSVVRARQKVVADACKVIRVRELE